MDKVTHIEIGQVAVVGGREKPVTSVSLDDKFCEESSSDQSQPVNLVRSCNYVSPFGVESIVNYFWKKSGCVVDMVNRK